MTDILKKIETLLIEEGVIPGDISGGLIKGRNIIDTGYAIAYRHKMEFSDSADFSTPWVGTLTSQDDMYIDEDRAPWRYCRYLQNEWIVNPNMVDRSDRKILPHGLKIEILLRNGVIHKVSSQFCNFEYSSVYHNDTPDPDDIVAYNILGPAKDWVYEWEDERI